MTNTIKRQELTDPRTILAEMQARADGATEGPWEARTTGVANGDHWYVCDAGEAIAHISTQDGINEDQRGPDATFIAHARTDHPAMVAALVAVMDLHYRWGGTCAECSNPGWNILHPCPTVRAITDALGS